LMQYRADRGAKLFVFTNNRNEWASGHQRDCRNGTS
jgi:hypothetical protein